MSLITIDQELCDKDGICAAECPMRIIDMKNGGMSAGLYGYLKLEMNGCDKLLVIVELL